MRGERLSIYFGQSAETSDFIVDCLELWWQENQAIYPGLEELVIDLDGGAATRSNRTQFIKRMVDLPENPSGKYGSSITRLTIVNIIQLKGVGLS